MLRAALTGGPDLAENIPVSDLTIGAGDLVSVDTAATTSGEYDTYQGQVYDLFSAKKAARAYDPQMLGVISTDPSMVLHTDMNAVENGDITPAGNRPIVLTGRTLVKVSLENGPIEEGDYVTSSDIPGVGMKATKSGQVIGQALQSFDGTASSTGAILVFVKPGYYNGESIEDFAGISMASSSDALIGRQVLAAFLNQATSTVATSTNSELLVDRIAAGVEIVTPQITAHGLTIDTVSSLNDAIKFANDTIFFGRPYFNSDTAGFAVIHQGATSVDVTFDQPYLDQPIVNASISINDSSNTAAVIDAESSIFSNNVQYLVANKSVNGFTIIINKPAPTDIPFSWTAFAVKGTKTFDSVISAPPASQVQTSTPPTDNASSSDTTSTSSSDTTSATSSDSTASSSADTSASSTDTTSTGTDATSSASTDTSGDTSASSSDATATSTP